MLVPFTNTTYLFSNTVAMAQGYDNSYYGDNNSYSKYPTDNKKYECRTGPFEGYSLRLLLHAIVFSFYFSLK
jgi:hypothetical protein